MTNPTAHERVRSALEDVVAGNSPPRAFEGFIAEMIETRVLTPNDARVEVEAAVRDGTLPPDSLRRLGLDGAAVVTQPYARSEDQTQIRFFTASPLAAEAPAVEEDAPPMFAQPAPVETGSVWIEPGTVAEDRRAGSGALLSNRYQLEYKIGEGGMGVVYRATDLEVKGETFAIKVLKPAIRERPESLKVMREEVRKTRALRHPNIVGVYSLNSDPAGVYMLMEYLEGKSVSALIDEDFGRGMPMMRAWPLIHDIGSALAYAHDHNVIHSDLKPSNLFVTISGKAMLLDFGIARAVRTRAGRFDTGSLGALTPAYASSEMLSGGAPDQTDDIYSFACVIYEMLSGKHPFNGLGALDAQRAGMRPAPLASLTLRQNQALARALAFERAQRTGSVEALLKGLEPTPERRSWSLPSSLQRPPQWTWVAGGAALCLIVGIGIWAITRKPGSEHPRTASIPAAPIASAERPRPAPAPAAAPAEAPPSPAASAPVAVAPTIGGTPAPIQANPQSQAARKDFPSPGKLPEPLSTKAKHDSVAAAGPPRPDISSASGGGPAVAAPQAAREEANETAASAGTSASAEPGMPAAGAGATAAEAPPKIAAAGAEAAGAAEADAHPASAEVDRAAIAEGGAAVAAAAATPAAAEPSALPAVPLPPGPPAIVDNPPAGKKFPAIIPLPESATNLSSCPYPEEARRQLETGTVVLLVHVSPTGGVTSTHVESSSGSASLDAGATTCVRQYGQFAPKVVGKPSAGYWGRMKFNWSFGD